MLSQGIHAGRMAAAKVFNTRFYFRVLHRYSIPFPIRRIFFHILRFEIVDIYWNQNFVFNLKQDYISIIYNNELVFHLLLLPYYSDIIVGGDLWIL